MALTDKLTAIGDAIRTKTGKTATMTLDQMVTEIESIESGTEEIALTFTGDLSSFDMDGRVEDLFNHESVNITYANITSMDNMHQNATGLLEGETVGYNKYMFDGCTSLKSVKGLSNVTDSATHETQYMFRNCTNLESVDIPDEGYLGSGTHAYMFAGCNNLTTLPSSIKFNPTSVTSASLSNTFADCYRLKSIPDDFLLGLALGKVSTKTIFMNGSSSSLKNGTSYSNTFKNCLSLKSLNVYRQGRYATYSASNTSLFAGVFDNMPMLKTIRFCSNSISSGGYYDYSHGYTIDLSTCGYLADSSYVDIMTEMYGSPVTTQEEYEAKKDTEDWWTTDPAFSRFDLVSFIDAITYLPKHGNDSSGTSTTSYIKFKGGAGSNTTNGAIESTNSAATTAISYATSNGWTIAYV